MMLTLLSVMTIVPSPAVAWRAQCSPGGLHGSQSCSSGSDDGDILLHTRSQLAVSGGITDREEMESQVITSAFELDHLGIAHLYRGSRESTLSHAQQTTKVAQRSAWISYRGTLQKVLSNLETSRHAANGQLEDTIDKFIASQAGSEDACHAQLLETKHQLNQLHQHVQDLSVQINATDHELTALNAQVESKLDDVKRLEEKCNTQFEDIEAQQAEDLKFLETLRGELEEMIQIANPDVTMNQTGREVFAGGKAVESLLGSQLQADAFRSFLARIKLPSHKASVLAQGHGTSSASFVQMRVQENGEMTEVRGDHDVLSGLRQAMSAASHCMQGQEKRNPLSLMHAKKRGTQHRADAKHQQTPAPTTEAPEENEEYYYPKKPTGEGSEVEGPEGPGPLGANDGSEGPGGPGPLGVKGNLTVEEDNAALPEAKKVHCATSDLAKVQVGDVNGEVSPPRSLEKGEVAQIPCLKINKAYFGVIWLTCNEELEASGSQCLKAANATKCQEELETLQKVYVKTYVDLARLIQSYEEKTTDGYEASKQAIEDQCRDRREPLQAEAAKLAGQASEKIKQLEELRPKLEDATEAYHKLKAQVDKLTEQCEALPETVTDLDKVRDAIKALSLCPGLNKARLIVPKWVGTYTLFEEDYAKLSDDEFDNMMLEACEKAFGAEYPDKVLRAASVAEMQAHSVLDLPVNNTADTPLIGPCPGCEGNECSSTETGHLRVCWKPGAQILGEERFMQCSQGQKSIACVIDGDK